MTPGQRLYAATIRARRWSDAPAWELLVFTKQRAYEDAANELLNGREDTYERMVANPPRPGSEIERIRRSESLTGWALQIPDIVAASETARAHGQCGRSVPTQNAYEVALCSLSPQGTRAFVRRGVGSDRRTVRRNERYLLR